MTVRIFIPMAGLLLTFFLLPGCTGPDDRPTSTVQSPQIVWPDPPETARVSYVSSFSHPRDFGIVEGPFAALARVLFGERALRLVRPMAVVATKGVIYVADPGAQGVHRFDRVNNRHSLILFKGEGPLPSPVGLALGAGGDVYVTDSVLGQVLVIRERSDRATPVRLEKHLGRPTGIAFDPVRKELFVVDTAAHRIYVFDHNGAVLREFGERGDADGAFNYPTLIWRTKQGALYVADALNFRVQSFDGLGRWQGKFGRHGDGTGDLVRHKGIATDKHGHIYVVDSLFHALQVFDKEGRFLLSVGELGQNPGEFWLPSGVFVDEDDTIFVADSYNRRVQIFRYVGGPT